MRCTAANVHHLTAGLNAPNSLATNGCPAGTAGQGWF